MPSTKRSAALAGLLILASAGAGPATAGPALAATWPMVASATVAVCHNFGCSMQTPVTFTAKDLAALRVIVVAGRGSPAAERRALGKAVQWFERRVGPVVGTSGDLGGFERYLATPDQQDCVDESTNTTRLLKLIESRGWLTHHRVGPKAVRGFLVDGRYPHNTAVVVEKTSGVKWAIDSWMHANAEPPDIMPLAIWLKSGRRWFRHEG